VRCRESWSLQTPAALPRQTAAAAFPATSTAFVFSSRSSHSTTMRELQNEVDHKTSFLCQKNNNYVRKQKRTQAVRERASERERALSESRSNNKRQNLVLAGTVRAIDRRSDPWHQQSPKTRNCFTRSRSSSSSMQALRSSSMESLQMQNGILSVFVFLNFSFLQVQLHLNSRK
jgi:predicted unusual protein kinase regulating ubiquinone biosynthesis (AarF/ABC1/UbiB family)